jgi:hypothetical protein
VNDLRIILATVLMLVLARQRVPQWLCREALTDAVRNPQQAGVQR